MEEQTATTGEMARNVAEAADSAGEIVESIGGVATQAQGSKKMLDVAVADLAVLVTEAKSLSGKVERFTIAGG